MRVHVMDAAHEDLPLRAMPEAFEERAAIMEFDGLSRQDAERAVTALIRRHRLHWSKERIALGMTELTNACRGQRQPTYGLRVSLATLQVGRKAAGISCPKILLRRFTMISRSMDRQPLRLAELKKLDVYVRVIAGILPKDMTIKAQQLDDLTDDQLMRKLADLTEKAKPLLARLPAVIDAAPVRTDVGALTNTEDKYCRGT